MSVSIRKTYIEPGETDWQKGIKLVEVSNNNRLLTASVYIAGKLAAIFDNMFDAWDLINDGPEFLRELKASNDFCFIHQKTGAVISNSLGPITNE